MRRDELAWLLLPLLLFDLPRYFLGTLMLWCADVVHVLGDWALGRRDDPAYTYQPSVCVVIAGLNEGPSLRGNLDRLVGSYPDLQIIVVDDGSSDGMTQVGHDFARLHDSVLVLTKRRGGKSSAMNFALPFARAEVVIVVDADSHLAPNAIWEIVQPLADPRVGAVSGNVLVRNEFQHLVTRLQGLEYQRSIFLGRMISDRLNLLGIASGAFVAIRRTALRHVRGWDVGPGEDEDSTLRLRKVGYQVAFAPYAECWTDAPTTWRALVRQRRRWEWAVVTFGLRKHIDMVNVLSPAARPENVLLLLERWLFNLFCPIVFWVWLIWWCLVGWPERIPNVCLLYYLLHLAMETANWLILLNYSAHRLRDLRLGIVLPLMPFYQLIQRCVTTWAIVEETFTRRSYRDGFVPEHVREATWHW